MNENRKREMEDKIRLLASDIETYREAIESLENVVVEAERELDEVLYDMYGAETDAVEKGVPEQ